MWGILESYVEIERDEVGCGNRVSFEIFLRIFFYKLEFLFGLYYREGVFLVYLEMGDVF